MFSGQEPKRIDVVLEYYRQACLNMRMYVDLRFKHFTTLVVITGFLGAAAFNVSGLTAWRAFLLGLALVITLLFWFIDFRTAQYWKHEFLKIQVLEQALNEGFRLLLPPAERVIVRSSAATSFVFLVLASSWAAALVATSVNAAIPSTAGVVSISSKFPMGSAAVPSAPMQGALATSSSPTKARGASSTTLPTKP